MPTTSSTLETPTPSSSPSSSHGSNGAAIAVGIIFGILAVILLVGMTWWLLRRRKLQREVKEAQITSRRPKTVVDPNHLAFRVSPFASPGDAPRFGDYISHKVLCLPCIELVYVVIGHNPGENMRVAHRRPDGGWEFTDMEPSSLSPFDPAPLSPALSSRTTLLLKDKLLPGELTTRGFIERDMDGVPPPLYTEEDSYSTEV